MEDSTTILAFCANEQADTEHVVDVDGSGEIVLTCACGRFLKFPMGTDAATLKELLATHKEQNEGQISVAAIAAQKQAILDGLKES